MSAGAKLRIHEPICRAKNARLLGRRDSQRRVTPLPWQELPRGKWPVIGSYILYRIDHSEALESRANLRFELESDIQMG